MKANPGGFIPPSEVIGRDKLIGALWRTLETRSIVLTAERRMGKTSIIKKMEAEAHPEFLPKYRDLEQVHSPIEFSQIVFEDVETHLSRVQRISEKARRFLGQLGGTQIGGVFKFPEKIESRHWKPLLTHLIEDLVGSQDRKLVFLWDELPFMIDNIAKRVDPPTAMEVLDTLRALRQSHPNLRMVYTGSIGLHHVLRTLKKLGYSNAPKNDMATVDVPPLTAEDAADLARRLIAGEGLTADKPEVVAAAIVAAVDRIPYRIHYVIEQIVTSGRPLTQDSIEAIISECLCDAQDCWNLRHYRERIATYYAAEEQSLALHVLDILSTATGPVAFDELFNQIKSRTTTEDVEAIRNVLILLQSDHYVGRDPNGSYQFRLPLIARWWRLERGLGK